MDSIFGIDPNLKINVPDDFNNIYYWLLNDDLQLIFNKNDANGLIEHWINNGKNENRKYNISDNIINKFDHKVYYLLYDDIQNIYKKDDYEHIIIHYIKYGINEQRICSINDIHLPNNYFTDNYYEKYRDLTNFKSIYDIPILDKVKIHYYKIFGIFNIPKKINIQNVPINQINNNKDILFIIYEKNYKKTNVITKNSDNLLILNDLIDTKNNDIVNFLELIKILLDNYKNYQYYYYLTSYNINNNFINKIKKNNNIIYGNFNYNNKLELLEILNNNFIFTNELINVLISNISIKDIKNYINDKYSISLVISKILASSVSGMQPLISSVVEIKPIISSVVEMKPLVSSVVEMQQLRIKIPILFIFEVDEIDFTYMYQTWIKYINKENNIYVLIVSKYYIDILSIIDETKKSFIFFNKLNDNLIDIVNQIAYVKETKDVIFDWLIYSSKKIFVNLNNLYNTVIKWYSFDILYENNIYCFKEYNMNNMFDYIININNDSYYNKINQKINIIKTTDIVNYDDNCNIDKYFIVII